MTQRPRHDAVPDRRPRRLRAIERHVAASAQASAAGDHQWVDEYRCSGLEWNAPARRVPADEHDIPDPMCLSPATGVRGRDLNSPLGKGTQGYMQHGTHPTFDPETQFDEALAFYRENGFMVFPLLSDEALHQANATCDEWCGVRGDEIAVPGQGELFFPLVHYPEVDGVVVHPVQKRFVSAILRGWENARMIEFNYRGWDPVRDRSDVGMTWHADTAGDHIPFEEYATRQPYGPPDCLMSFVYLTDVSERSPSFAVIPKSRRAHNIVELKDKLGPDYAEVPIRGPAGTCCLVDANIIHTRLDPDPSSDEDAQARRLFHMCFGNAALLENADGSPRTPNLPCGFEPSMFARGVAGPRLTESEDPETRRVSADQAPYHTCSDTRSRIACPPDQRSTVEAGGLTQALRFGAQLYSWWTSTQHEWKAAGYDPDFIGDPKAARGPTRGKYSHDHRADGEIPSKEGFRVTGERSAKEK